MKIERIRIDVPRRPGIVKDLLDGIKQRDWLEQHGCHIEPYPNKSTDDRIVLKSTTVGYFKYYFLNQKLAMQFKLIFV